MFNRLSHYLASYMRFHTLRFGQFEQYNYYESLFITALLAQLVRSLSIIVNIIVDKVTIGEQIRIAVRQFENPVSCES